jgi:hypothetical protein
VFHFSQFRKSRLASTTLDRGAEIVVVVRIVKSPPFGYVGVGIVDTAEEVVKGDFGDWEAILLSLVVDNNEDLR